MVLDAGHHDGICVHQIKAQRYCRWIRGCLRAFFSVTNGNGRTRAGGVQRARTTRRRLLTCNRQAPVLSRC